MTREFKSMDGNNAAAYVSYAFTEVAGIYPITPSSPMADLVDQWSAAGKKNIFGTTVKVCEMQSEGGAAGAVHGSLAAGALTTTYTASQGLLLMIPNMYKMAGELLPCVFHVSARTLATHALTIFGDHSDVMACRQTGFAMLAETQRAGGHGPGRRGPPVRHQGPRPLHQLLRRLPHLPRDPEDRRLGLRGSGRHGATWTPWSDFRKHALNPERPAMRGTHENGDIFFQHREACNGVYDALPAIVEDYMDKVNAKLGTNYELFNYYGAPDADRVIVAMGSFCDVVEEVVDYLNAQGQKVGLVKVRLYRPFVSEKLLAALPATVQKIAVLDRTKEPGALGEPLYLDVHQRARARGPRRSHGGRRPLRPGRPRTPRPLRVRRVPGAGEGRAEARVHRRHRGRRDHTCPWRTEGRPNTAAAGTIECKFWGLGGDGTVGANKNSIKIIGDHTDKYVQAYFQYDSKKTGGVTISHLRFGDQPIRSPLLHQQGRLRGLPQPRLHHQGLPHGPRREAGRRVPDQLPVD